MFIALFFLQLLQFDSLIANSTCFGYSGFPSFWHFVLRFRAQEVSDRPIPSPPGPIFSSVSWPYPEIMQSLG